MNSVSGGLLTRRYGSVSAERQFRRQHNNLPADACCSLGLDQSAEPSGDARFQPDDFARPGGAENFHRSQRGQFQIIERWNLRVALRHHACELRRGLDEQHAGENRFTRKMAA